MVGVVVVVVDLHLLLEIVIVVLVGTGTNPSTSPTTTKPQQQRHSSSRNRNVSVVPTSVVAVIDRREFGVVLDDVADDEDDDFGGRSLRVRVMMIDAVFVCLFFCWCFGFYRRLNSNSNR